MIREVTWQLIFIALFVSMAIIRIYYHWKAGTYREQVYTEAEGKPVAAARGLLGISWFLGAVAYMINPAWMAWAALPAPEWARWLGAGLGVTGVMLIFWVNYALSENFSTTLRVRDDHTLVMHGPYRRVRHPMYTAIVLLLAAFGVIASNWFIGGVGLAAIGMVIVVRTPREERLLAEKFGGAYEAYRRQTGRYLPRLRAST